MNKRKTKNHQEWEQRFEKASAYMKLHFSLDEIELMVEERKLRTAYDNLFRVAEKMDGIETLKQACDDVKLIIG